MKTNKLQDSEVKLSSQKIADKYRELSNKILQLANFEIPRIDYMRKVAAMILDFSHCDSLELWIRESNKVSRCEVIRFAKDSFQFEIISSDKINVTEHTKTSLELLCLSLIFKLDKSHLFNFPDKKSLWSGDVQKDFPLFSQQNEQNKSTHEACHSHFNSLALIPLIVANDNVGILLLKSRKLHFFTQEEIESYEATTQTIANALMNQYAQAALRERVKELTCLYNLAQLAERPGISVDEILQSIMELIPPAWQYPEITQGRIKLDRKSYTTPTFEETVHKQCADIVVNHQRRGVLEVYYAEEKPNIDEGPFLKEERNLINAIAREIGHIIERRQAEDERVMLQEQLRHADRLATIGQLAAGVAHELNEPIGNILGFAQLIQKIKRIPLQAKQDVEKIVASSLHAREVIKKLMLFARQTSSEKISVDLNEIVAEGLYFFEARCTKAGIELQRSLAPVLPHIIADPSQLNQVLVNLVVNAIQAMPDGGKLLVRTDANEQVVSLMVEDTGVGMDEKIMEQIFIPFFTTKDIDQGTGLGLAVVHGIVTAHKGTIHVESKLLAGSKFTIELPIKG